MKIQLHDEFIHHSLDDLRAQGVKSDHSVEAVTKFRAEHLFDRLLAFARVGADTKSQRGTAQLSRSGVGRHDQDDVAEVCFSPVIISQCCMIHDLEQDTEEIGMGLFDLV